MSIVAGYPFELDRFQLEAIDAIDAGRHVVVAAPTGSGKTVVAEYVQFFGDPWLRRLTQEFLSPDFHSRDLYPFLFALLGVMALLALRPRPHWTHLMVILGTLGMALISQRNIVQFGLIAVPLIALDQNTYWKRRIGASRFATNFGAAAKTGVTWPWAVVVTALLLGLAVSRGRVGDREVIPDGFSPGTVPRQGGGGRARVRGAGPDLQRVHLERVHPL